MSNNTSKGHVAMGHLFARQLESSRALKHRVETTLAEQLSAENCCILWLIWLGPRCYRVLFLNDRPFVSNQREVLPHNVEDNRVWN